MKENEYRAALARIDEIFECSPDTPEAEELSRLCGEVQSYEEEHFPIDKPTDEDISQFRE